jgi:hypothetical protein
MHNNISLEVYTIFLINTKNKKYKKNIKVNKDNNMEITIFLIDVFFVLFYPKLKIYILKKRNIS